MRRQIKSGTRESAIKGVPESDNHVIVKKELGITLIALVVTTITMLILAGVALSMALGDNGIIKQAKFSTNKYEEAAINEEKTFIDAKAYLYGFGKYQMNNIVLLLSGDLNVGGEHSSETDTWNDISGVSGKNATKSKGTSQWSEKSLILDGTTTYTVNAPVEDSFGTVEVCVKIDKDFNPSNETSWNKCSTIFGCELSGTQKDWAIILDNNGKFAIGYNSDTVYSSEINALDEKIHTITYSYLPEKLVFAIDGKIITTIKYTPQGDPIKTFGIGWNNRLGWGKTEIKGEIYSIRFYRGELAEQDIKRNYEGDKSFQ